MDSIAEESPSEKSLQRSVKIIPEDCDPDVSPSEELSLQSSVHEQSVSKFSSDKESIEKPVLNDVHISADNSNDQNPENIDPVIDLFTTAQQVTASDIAEFLKELELPEYISRVLEEDINGQDLLTLDLTDLEVTNPLHQLKIKHLFKRKLEKRVAKYSKEHLSQFLIRYKYPPCEELDGDMILEEDEKLLSSVLGKIGIESPLQQMKIIHLYKREVLGCEIKHPKQHVIDFLAKNELDRYASTFESHEIDGDMILEIEEGLMNKVLKEMGVILKHRTTLRSKYIEFCK